MRRILNMARVNKQQNGDAIIEVMIVMAVLSGVLVAAFSLATRAISTSRDTQEHTEALKLAESQLELLKSYSQISGNNVTTNSFTSFCIDMASPAPLPNAMAVDAATSPKCNNIDGAGNPGGLYNVKITANGSPYPVYQVNISWELLGRSSLNLGHVTLDYRLGG